MNIEMKTCPTCGLANFDFHRHHILPRSLGGLDRDSNIVKICKCCHGKIHNTKFISHSFLTKKALRKKMSEGKKLGPPKNNTNRTGWKKTYDSNMINMIKKLTLAGKTTRQIGGMLNISCGTVCRLQYKFGIKKEINGINQNFVIEVLGSKAAGGGAK